MDCIVHGVAELDMTEQLSLFLYQSKKSPNVQSKWRPAPLVMRKSHYIVQTRTKGGLSHSQEIL